MRAGFIGLGNMGAPMAGHIQRAGHQLVTYDLAGGERAPEGAQVVDSEAALAAEVDIVLTCLPDGATSAAVNEALVDADGSRVAMIVECGTIGVEAARTNAAWCGARKVSYLDAPISGGVAGAKRGSLTAICSGAASDVERVRPLLEPWAGNVFHVGREPGQGQALKLLNNFLSGTAMAATAEAMAMGARYGLDMKTMLDVVNVSTGQNTATLDKYPARVLTGSYDAGFTSKLFNKDLGLYFEAAKGGARPVSDGVVSLWRTMLEAHGDEDMTRIYPFVRDEVPKS